MKIETKHDIGDKVWIVDPVNNRAIKVTVEEIHVAFRLKEPFCYYYLDGGWVCKEDEVFGSRKEALK